MNDCIRGLNIYSYMKTTTGRLLKLNQIKKSDFAMLSAC